MKNSDVLQKFYKENRPAMFVANHCSWMDIPFLGATIGWRNYKLISKKELGVVPILGTAIRAGGNIMVDRTDRRSQFATLKQGINYLKVRILHCDDTTERQIQIVLRVSLCAFCGSSCAGGRPPLYVSGRNQISNGSNHEVQERCL